MFCPKCGKGDQTADSYCRSCGDFLVDPAQHTSLMNRILGITSPEKQVKFTLTIDLVTAIVSGFLKETQRNKENCGSESTRCATIVT